MHSFSSSIQTCMLTNNEKSTHGVHLALQEIALLLALLMRKLHIVLLGTIALVLCHGNMGMLGLSHTYSCVASS